RERVIDVEEVVGGELRVDGDAEEALLAVLADRQLEHVLQPGAIRVQHGHGAAAPSNDEAAIRELAGGDGPVELTRHDGVGEPRREGGGTGRCGQEDGGAGHDERTGSDQGPKTSTHGQTPPTWRTK